MNSQPRNFEYHEYLRKILHAEESKIPFYMATEKDFQKISPITYPYRSYFYAFGILHSGSCKIRVGVRDFEMKKGSLTMVGPGITRLWLTNNWKIKNTTFFFTPEFFGKPFYNNFVVDYPFFKTSAEHVIHLGTHDYNQACEFISLMKLTGNNLKASSGVMFAFLEFIQAIYSKTAIANAPSGNSSTIVSKFNEFLQSDFQEHKEVSHYADKLSISPKHLSELLKTETGKTAKQNIEDFLFFEAKSLLKQTQMSVKEIVFWLGFDDPSHFSKQFKQHTGRTPQQYRDDP